MKNVKFTEDRDEEEVLFGMFNVSTSDITLTEILDSLTEEQLKRLLERIKIEIEMRKRK
ncbi:MAG: hypothetical protein QXU98_13280 [Candidatus Parvarchaeota archaeon]